MANYLDLTNKSREKYGGSHRLAKFSGIIKGTVTITQYDTTLRDFESGKYIFLDIEGSSDVTITLPEPRAGLNFTFIAAGSPDGAGDAVIKANTDDTIMVQQLGKDKQELIKPNYTITAAGALVASNSIACSVDGDALSATAYASSSDATLQAFATKLAALDEIESATVTVIGGNQTGSDDRIILVEGANKGVDVEISTPIVTGGSSQTTFEVVTTKQAVQNMATSLYVNEAADNIKLETAGLGGEWIELVASDTFWYARTSAASNSAITING